MQSDTGMAWYELVFLESVWVVTIYTAESNRKTVKWAIFWFEKDLFRRVFGIRTGRG